MQFEIVTGTQNPRETEMLKKIPTEWIVPSLNTQFSKQIKM